MRLDAALAHALSDHGVDTIFGVLADPTMLLMDAYVGSCGGRYIAAAHEAGAAHMAYGYSVIARRTGVACIDHGPGVTNALTAIIDGVKARANVLVVCPDTVIEDKHYRQNILQRDIILAAGAGLEHVRSPRTLLEDTALAFRRVQHEHRPIVLNVPREFLGKEVEYRRTVLDPLPDLALRLDEAALDKAVGLIASARRPIVLAGRGAVHARATLVRLAERIGAPLATSLGGKGLFEGEPFDIGIFGTLSHEVAAEVIAKADCVIAFGAGLNPDTTSKGGLLAGKRFVQCDIEPSRLDNFVRVDCAIAGDADEIASTILEWLDHADAPATSFRSDALRVRLAEHRANPPTGSTPTPGTVDLRSSIRRIDEVVPHDRIYVNDPGRHAVVTWPGIRTASPTDFVLTAHFGAIGTGMGIAVGAGSADRSRPVLLVAGDGAFMLGGLTEFNTAVRTGLDLIAVICNDGSYGPEHQMLVQWGYSPSLVEFDWPDFGPVGTALGGQGITVRSDQDLDTACELIQSRTAPVLVDLRLDPHQVPPLDH